MSKSIYIIFFNTPSIYFYSLVHINIYRIIYEGDIDINKDKSILYILKYLYLYLLLKYYFI